MRTSRGRNALRLAVACIAAALAAPTARADDQSNEALRRELDELKKKVEALEKAKASEPKPAEAASGAARASEAPPPARAAETAKPGDAAPESEDDELRKLREDSSKEADAAPAKAGSAATAPVAGGTGGGSSGGGGGGGASAIQSLNAFNPRMSVFGDFVGRMGLDGHPHEQDDRMSLSEVEVDLRADVDPYAKAVVILSVEEEAPGEYAIGPEEGYVTLEALPWNLRAQIGRWRQRFGQANRTHKHDLMWVDYPLVIRDMLGPDGLGENGIALLWLAPTLPLELEATVLNGDGGAEGHVLAGPDSRFPALLGRASYQVQIDRNIQELSLGTSYLLGYNDLDQKQSSLLAGLDVMYTYKPSTRNSLSVMAELFHLDKENAHGVPGDHALGGYVGVNVQPMTQQLYLGARYDLSDYTDQIGGNFGWAASAYVSWYTTEFLRFRLGYEHQERSVTANPDPALAGKYDTVMLQVTFIFGSHPAEPFWVNR